MLWSIWNHPVQRCCCSIQRAGLVCCQVHVSGLKGIITDVASVLSQTYDEHCIAIFPTNPATFGPVITRHVYIVCSSGLDAVLCPSRSVPSCDSAWSHRQRPRHQILRLRVGSTSCYKHLLKTTSIQSPSNPLQTSHEARGLFVSLQFASNAASPLQCECKFSRNLMERTGLCNDSQRRTYSGHSQEWHVALRANQEHSFTPCLHGVVPYFMRRIPALTASMMTCQRRSSIVHPGWLRWLF